MINRILLYEEKGYEENKVSIFSRPGGFIGIMGEI